MRRDSILNGFLISFKHHFRTKQSTADLTFLCPMSRADPVSSFEVILHWEPLGIRVASYRLWVIGLNTYWEIAKMVGKSMEIGKR